MLFVANSDGDIRRALMIADEFKLKPIIAGALYGYRVADMLKARNVPVILSLDFPKRSADLPTTRTNRCGRCDNALKRRGAQQSYRRRV